MTDREKVISELFKFREEMRTCNSTTYAIASKKVRRMNLIDKTIALLKAQEPVEPTIGGDADGPYKNWWYQCGKCKETVIYHDKYCRNCGQEVKWE